MFKVLAAAALVAGLAAPSLAQERSGEVGYPVGSLGYDALVRGDVQAAELQLERGSGVASTDPARLINLGYVHMRAGRFITAQTLFQAVRDSEEHFIVELANGETADTRDVARRALGRLQMSMASR
ncbi:tetratricopeptide repeat protein [Sphingomonas lacunae]|uniref:Tetratricopeptide repeat protein n=1 Tax=Sphingomonas lacunae TaxID=2698828 RepID=A0A6M4B042_9SPHN|nr:tetratricopeptide repeat protein [Sphingomonas lacunae]QJQ32681.1 tetratricopeptide repeat protein [Sphingomonas lacunae]